MVTSFLPHIFRQQFFVLCDDEREPERDNEQRHADGVVRLRACCGVADDEHDGCGCKQDGADGIAAPVIARKKLKKCLVFVKKRLRASGRDEPAEKILQIGFPHILRFFPV